MNRFLSSKNTITVTILWLLVALLIAVIALNIQNKNASIVPFIIISTVTAFILWVLLDTRYVLKNNFLLYRSGPFRGRIDITKINKIRNHSGLYVPVLMKPALDTKGFIITYNKFEEVFISPIKSELFLEELMKINPKIEIQ